MLSSNLAAWGKESVYGAKREKRRRFLATTIVFLGMLLIIMQK